MGHEVSPVGQTGSLRISQLSPWKSRRQRFLRQVDFHKILERLFDGEAEFYIGDVTEVERSYTRRTSYVGRLSDGKTRGFQVFFPTGAGRSLLPSPFTWRGPFRRTRLRGTLSSTVLIGRVKELIGDRLLILDREFSHLGFFEEMGVRFVVRLKTGNRPRILDGEGEEVWLGIKRGERRVWRDVKVKGNVAGY